MAQSTPGATEQSCLICKAVANINLITPVESQAAELDALCNGLEGEDSILVSYQCNLYGAISVSKMTAKLSSYISSLHHSM